VIVRYFTPCLVRRQNVKRFKAEGALGL
jgi:hypothetical protein